MSSVSRPELTGDASLFYNEKEARKYDSSSRMINVQREITERAIELLRLDDDQPSFVLDIGCGSGLSGQVLEEHGHVWVGCDLSRDMLTVARERMDRQTADALEFTRKKSQTKNGMEEEDEENDSSDDMDEDEDASPPTGDLMHHDMGTGLPFRPAMFDACISISALQWLCYSNAANQRPRQRLTRFFSSLYTVLKKGGRAVLQFYPETAEQAVLISETATNVGFSGGVVVDYPNSAKAKKHYLVLGFDRNPTRAKQGAKGSTVASPARVTVFGDGAVSNGGGKKQKPAPKKKKGGTKTKEWILHKKDTQRTKGKNVRPDTKYTGRKRPTKF